MSVVMRVPGGDVSGRELTFNIPLKDLGTAFDGKPTDPKVLEQQRPALQQQLQKKAEEQRKALEQQQSGARRPRRLLPLQLRRSGEVIRPQASRDGGRPEPHQALVAPDRQEALAPAADGLSSGAIDRGRNICRPPSA